MVDNILAVLDVAELTDVGLKRQKNEDTPKMLVPPPGTNQEELGALFMVADGMGGLGGGDVASKIAVEQIARGFYSPDNPGTDTLARLKTAMESANVQVREQAPRLGLPRIGSTAAGMILSKSGDVLAFNVGDCRIYRVRGNYIEPLSRDQSVMARQIESGMLTEEEAKVQRSSMVTAFIGQPIPLEPGIRRETAREGDVFVMCSDGLWSLVDANEILEAIKRNPARIAVRKLIRLALKRGGNDNVTAVVVRIGRAPRRLGAFLLRLVALLAVVAIAVIVYLLVTSGVLAPAATATTPTQAALAGGTGTAAGAGSATPTRPASQTPAPATIVALLVSNTPRPTSTPTDTHTPTSTLTPRPSQTPSNTPTPSLTKTLTPTSTRSLTPTLRPSFTPSNTPTPAPTATEPPTALPSSTPFPTMTPTITSTPAPLNSTAAALLTISAPTRTQTPTNTRVPSNTPGLASTSAQRTSVGIGALTATPTGGTAVGKLKPGSYKVTSSDPAEALDSPKAIGNLLFTIPPGNYFLAVDIVPGDTVPGSASTDWLKGSLTFGNVTLTFYVHSSFATPAEP